MSYQVLARKWRPRSFQTLVGQEHVVRALTHALEQQRLHHAYLFTGTRGVGKTTIARILAKALNCDTGITAQPCGVCSACTEIDAGRFVDLLEVDAATNTRVDEMRQLLENAVYAPTRGRFKVYVIDEVHMLSNSAFNAMLKTLEEPPEHVKFILATTDPQKIPPTVLSRCLQFNLKQMPISAICGHLEHILGAEAIPFEIGALPIIGQAAHGSMRDALSLLDQAIAYGAGTLAEVQVRSMLGTIDQGYLFDILEALAAGDLAQAIATAESMLERSLAFDSALEDMATLLHRTALCQAAPDVLPETTPERARIVALAALLDRESVQLAYQIALIGRRDLTLAPDPFAGFTMALLRMHAFAPSSTASLTEAPGEAPTARRTPAPAPATVTRPLQATPPGPVAVPKPVMSKPVSTVETAPRVLTAPAPTLAVARAAAVQPLAAEKTNGPASPAPKPAPNPAADAATDAAPAATLAMLSPETWPSLVRTLALSGFSRQLAEQSELAGLDGSRLTLRIPPTARPLASYRDRLATSIEQQWGFRCTIEIHVAESLARTVASENAERRSNALAQAQATLDRDPFINELVSGFGATIESVAPDQPSEPHSDAED